MSTPWLSELLDDHPPDSGGSLAIGVITYGSLLASDELDSVFSRGARTVQPANVRGYRRVFNKHSARRLRNPTGNRAAVLNLRRDEEAWFNGLLVVGVHRLDLETYASREREYELVRIEPRYLTPRGGAVDTDAAEPEAIYTCRLRDGPRIDPNLEPVPDYLQLCLNGAAEWGDGFYHDFLRTSWTVRGRLDRVLGEIKGIDPPTPESR